jgi:hypothetical protein
VAGIRLGFPNTEARRRAVKLHDLHHVLTGYAADWTGEAEIAAWELGAGCGAHGAAWVLNTLALQYGVWIAPRRVLAAMARGRRSRSLYEHRELDEAMLVETIAQARSRLGIEPAPRPQPADVPVLSAFWTLGLALWAGPLALLVDVLAR